MKAGIIDIKNLVKKFGEFTAVDEEAGLVR
jgi:hypothetical protein